MRVQVLLMVKLLQAGRYLLEVGEVCQLYVIGVLIKAFKLSKLNGRCLGPSAQGVVSKFRVFKVFQVGVFLAL